MTCRKLADSPLGTLEDGLFFFFFFFFGLGRGTHPSQLDGYMAATTSNVYNGPMEVFPGVTVSQLIDVGRHFRSHLSVSPHLRHVSRSFFLFILKVLTFTPTCHCLGKSTRVFRVLSIVIKDGGAEARIEGAVHAVSLKRRRLDGVARLSTSFEHLIKTM